MSVQLAHSGLTDQVLAAGEHDLLIGLGPFVVGIVVVLLLIGAVAYGRWRRNREPGPPKAEEHGHGPEHPDGYEQGFREDAEIPRTDKKGRLTPQQVNELGAAGTRASDKDHRKPWQEGHSSSFGGG
ncbi:DUF6479 family protein [Streptomyces sp. NPDC059740]|uniref:DUF6479 family protein n=1 Tax=Streptomyces sp. NPDC059740 TaxID=3346926 RepID=UPI0036675D84